MNKYTVKIEGMSCGMCEAHICDTVRKTLSGAKKVAASRKKGEACFVCEGEADMAALEKAVAGAGYTFVSASSEPYRRRGLFG